MSPKNKKKLIIQRAKLDKLDNRLLSTLSNSFLSKFSFILFLGDIYSIGFTYN